MLSVFIKNRTMVRGLIVRRLEMITKEDIETERSPRGLRQFVTRRRSKIKNCKQERHKGLLKKGIYKVFVDEIIPLSLFCLKNYPNSYKILPKLGNQGFDAIVKDERGKIYEHLELTKPHDGKRTAIDAMLTVSRGYSNILTRNYKSGDDLNDMFPVIMEVCDKKSKKDYSDCSLVIVISFFPPFKEEEPAYIKLIQKLEKKIIEINFTVKKIYLLVIPLNKIVKIYG